MGRATRTPRKFTKVASEVIKEAREAAGLSQLALANRVDRSKTYIHKIESGARNVNAYDVVLIAHALRLTGAELMAMIERRL